MRGASEPRLGGGVGGAAAVAAKVSLAVQLEEEVLSLVRQHNPEKEDEMLHFFDK
jgi:spermidine synthase